MNRRPAKPGNHLSNLDRWLWLLALCIILLAYAARVYRIFDVPPSFTGDEAANLTDITRVLRGGYLPFYFEANNGREPLFIYLQVPLVALLGPVPYALRLTSALVGVLTVTLTYRLARDLFGQRDIVIARWAPLVAAFLLASSFWHVSLSRIGLRAISLPMLTVLAFILFWRGYSRGRDIYYLASGVMLGLALYTYIAGRLLPLVLILFLLGGFFWRRSMPTANRRGMALMGTAAAVASAPLAVFALGHPLLFWGRVASVSTLDTSAPSTLESVAQTMGMFVWSGNEVDTTFDPGARPMFSWPMGIAFIAGVVLALAALWMCRRKRPSPVWLSSFRPEVCLFCLLWLLIMILPSVFSYPAPHFLRTLGAAPAVYIFPALAIGLAAGRLSNLESRLWRRVGYSAIAVLVLASGAGDLWDYGRLATGDRYFYELDGDIYEVGLYIKQRTEGGDPAVYGDTQLMQYGTIRAVTKESPTVSFDSRRAVAFPSSPVEYLFLSKDAASRGFERYLPPDAGRFTLSDSRGKETVVGFRTDGRSAMEYNRTVRSAPLFWAQRTPAEPAAGNASIAGEIALRGYGVAYGDTLDPAENGVVRPGQRFRVVLAWEALKSPSQSYQISLKAFDGAGKTWAQTDSAAGGGRYPTDQWHPGERVYDMYDSTLDPTAPPGNYRLEVTVYDIGTLRIFPVQSADGQPIAQHYVLGDLQVEAQ